MKKLLLTLAGMVLLASGASAQLSGTKNIPGDYATLAAAITDLNAQGVGAGGVTLNLIAGNPETAPVGGYAITATGTAGNPIIITGNANTITAGLQVANGTFDAVFKIVGGDFITIQGFTMVENAGNVVLTPATNTMTEFGVLLVHASATDGCQNNTIQNNTITLNTAYTNSVGIFSTSASSQTNTSQDATSTAGTNSNNLVYGNTITAAYGIYFICPPITATVFETGNDIGGAGASTGNTITFGNATASSGPWNRSTSTNQAGIVFRNGAGNSVRFNNITSNSAAYVGSAGLNGVQVSSGTAPTGVTYTSTISNNTISLTSTGIALISGIDFGHGIATGTIVGSDNSVTINQNVGAASTAAINGIKANYTSATNTANNNTVVINQSSSTGANSGAVTGINAAGAGTTVTVNGSPNITLRQTVSGGTFSGTMRFIDVNATSGTVNVKSNNLNTSGGSIRSTGTLTGVFQDSTVTVLVDIQNNTFNVDRVATSGSSSFQLTSGTPSEVKDIVSGNNITFTNLAGTSSVTAISSGGGPSTPAVNNKAIENNVINISGTHTGTSIGISNSFTNTGFIRGNSITIGCAAPTVTGISSSSSTTTMTISGNTLSLTSSTTSPTAMTGISEAGTGAHDISANTFSAMNFTGVITAAPTVSAIAISGGTGATVANHTITNISVGAAGSTASPLIDGISISGSATVTVSKNKIHGLTTMATGASTLINGIRTSGSTANMATTIVNNLIGAFAAPAAASPDAMRGLAFTSTGTTSSHNVAFNTVYLSGSSSGANFGGTGVFHTTSTTATTSSLTLRDNAIVNSLTPAGTGLAVAFRRSSGAANALANYNSASNNNDFFAGTPGAANLIYSDGTGTAQTIAAYKAGTFTAGTIAPRDTSTFTENPPFLSTSGASANFLHIDPTIATQLESGGIAVTGITDDFDGNTRNGTTPDVGADEFAGIPIDISGPTIVYTALPPTTLTTARTLTATITDASGVPTAGAGLPVLYWRINAGGYTAATGTSIGGNQFQFTFGAGVVGGDVVSYYVVAQDNALTPNVSANPSGGAGAFTSNPPAAGTPPTTPNAYTIVTGLAGTYTVGTGGNFTSLTQAAGAFATINAGVQTGDIILNVITDLTGEDGANALNEAVQEGGTWSTTIKPSGAARLVTGSSTGAIIKLNGADRVTVDGSLSGGTDRSLTITNTNGAAGTVLWIASANATNGANNNTLKNLVITGSGGATTTGGIIAGSGGTLGAAGDTANSNNTITNCGISRVSNGMFISGNATTLDQNWLITGNSLGSTVAADKLAFRGILVQGVNNFAVTGNTVAGVLSIGTSQARLSGVTVAGTSSNGIVNNNVIRDLKQINTGGWGSNGIFLGSGVVNSNITCQNNSISDVASYGFAGVGADDNGWGIIVNVGSGYKIYYNSVNIATNQTQTTGITAAINITAGVTATGAIDLRNNSFANPQTVGTRYGVYVAATSGAGVFTSINYNDYFAQNVGFLTSDRTTLANWQTATTQDANSLAADPQYSGPTNLIPNLGSPLLGAGTPIAGITTDLLGNTRSGTTPAIGAYETSVDLSGPVIAYTPLANTTSTANRTLSATVTDASGVPTAGAGLPVLYFRKGANPYVASTATSTGGSGYDVTFDYSLVGGVVPGDVISYYLAAQDNLGNVSVNPSAGAAGFTTNPPAVSTPPTTPNSFAISITYSGTYTVGTGGNFASLTLAGGAFAALNAGVQTGDIFLDITSDLTGEDGSNALNELAQVGGPFAVTIRPSGGARSVTGSSAASLIRFNGADRVTVDGSGTGATTGAIIGGDDSLRLLTITNTNAGTSACVVTFSAGTGGANNNAIRHVKVVGQDSATTVTGISVGGATGGSAGTNASVVIENCSVRKTIYGIYHVGTSLASQSTGAVVTKNDLSGTGANQVKRIGIFVANQNGIDISYNLLDGISSAESLDAIGIAVGLQDVNTTATSAGGVINSSITRNIIRGVVSTATAGYTAAGIAIAGDTGGANVIANNMISGVIAPATSPDFVAGIFVAGVTGSSTQVYYNSINLTGDRGSIASQIGSYGIAISGTDPTVDIRNNAVVDIQTSGGGANAKSYAIGTASTTFVNMTADRNAYFVAGAQAGFFRTAALGTTGTDFGTLAGWQTATGRDANSLFADPLFVSATDLHLTALSPAGNGGVVLAGYATDIDGNTRSALKPDIGADELAPSANAANLTISAGTLTPAFATGTLAYTDTVANAVTDVTVTPTVADTNATIEVQVNGGGFATVASGSPSANLPLNIGANTVDVRLTAEFGSPQLTYTVTVTRQAVLAAGTLNIDVNQGYSRVITQAEILAAATFSPGFSPTLTTADAVGTPGGGSIVVSPGVSATYTPAAPAFTGADSFNYVISNSLGQTAMGVININVVPPAFPPKPGTVTRTGGTFSSTYSGAVPGLTYRIQYSPNLVTAFADLIISGSPVTVVADGSGNFNFSDATSAPPKGFYRAVTP